MKSMILSKRQIKKRYNELLKDVESDEFYRKDPDKQIECYKCSCGHVTKTIHIDQGVTPWMHECEKCGKPCHGTFYVDIAKDQKPTQEWFRPTLEELIILRYNRGLVEHVLNGGLLNREIKTE